MSTVPRRTCPACARRYAGVVSPDCPLCEGLGVLNLGTAALLAHPAPVVARTVELYLEAVSSTALDQAPLNGRRREALEAARDDLRLAGVLYSEAADQARTAAHADQLADQASDTVTELDAHRKTRRLGATPTRRNVAALDAQPAATIAAVKPRLGLPIGSANGHAAALAVIADPIDPLGPDASALDQARRAAEFRAGVLTAALPVVLSRRQRKAAR